MALVRHAREDDKQALVAVGLRAWERAILGLADAADMRRVAQDAFRAFVHQGWLTARVMEADGEIAGWAARERMDGFISDLWIDPQRQSGGLGTLLLEAVETDIRADGFDEATITTHAQNDQAIAFLRRRGYAVNWLSTAYSAKLDRNVGSIGMIKRLVADEPSGYGPGGF